MTQNGIKKIAETKNLQQEFANVEMAVQVVDMTIFGPDHAKKNIKGRVSLSDGVSKMVCMVPDKVYNAMVSLNLLKKLKLLKMQKMRRKEQM